MNRPGLISNAHASRRPRGCLRRVLATFFSVMGVALGGNASAANSVTAGEFFVEPPTLINLAFEWRVDGDDNHNARVAVSYRKRGQRAWKPAMDLLRLNGERVLSNVRFDVISPNMFTGSVLDLDPDTEYEVQFVLSDPDGVAGQATRIESVRTRAEPMPYSGGRTFHVYPPNWTGTRIEPSFLGLMAAYNNSTSGTDMIIATRPRVRAGDTILVHAGLYKYRREFYTNDLTLSATPFDGTYYLTGKGEPGKPIAIKAAGDGEVIFDGNGTFNLFNVKAADYHYFEGLTIRNTEIAIWAGTQFIAGSKGLTVKKTKFEGIGMGVYTNHSRSSDYYIADNTFIGRNDPNHVIIWSATQDMDFLGLGGFPSDGEPSDDTPVKRYGSYIAVKVYGPGHVIAFNEVQHFHDGIDVETYGNPDGSFATDPNLPDTTNGPKYPPKEYWDRRPVAMDFYNNYLNNFHDNPFEMDGSLHNMRVMRNLMLNSASHAYCNQPTLGGPIYWIRNIAYHLPRGSTRGELTGAVFLNNNILSETAAPASSNMHWRNNLFMGENFTPILFSVTTNTNYTSSDYNGFRPNPGAATSFQWNSPPFNVLSDQPAPGYTPTRVTRNFATLDAYAAATGQDQHSVLVDYNVFVNVPMLNAQDPVQRTTVVPRAGLDFSLRAGANAAVDRGVVIPNVTDGFIGAAPDLGALERGLPPPQYGPRFTPHWQ
jgi:hypothetical protein